jgi:hypothetical protein
MSNRKIHTDPSTRVARWARIFEIPSPHVTRAAFWAATEEAKASLKEDRVILQDITRTRGDESLYTIESVQVLMREALRSFCSFHELEYMQGLNELLAPLLAINIAASPGHYSAVNAALSSAANPSQAPVRKPAVTSADESASHLKPPTNTLKRDAERAAKSEADAAEDDLGDEHFESELIPSPSPGSGLVPPSVQGTIAIEKAISSNASASNTAVKGVTGEFESEDGDEDEDFFESEVIVPEGEEVLERYARRCRESASAVQAASQRIALNNILDDAARKEALADIASALRAAEECEASLQREKALQNSIMQYNAGLCFFEQLVLRMCRAVYSTDGMLALQVQLASFHSLLYYIDATLAGYLGKHAMRCDLYAQAWLITLFARRAPVELALYVWEHMFQRDYLKSPHKLICLCVAFIILHRRTIILDVPPEELPAYLSRLCFKSEAQVDSTFSLAERVFNAIPPAQLRDIQLYGFDARCPSTVRELMMRNMMTRSCATSSAIDIAANLMKSSYEERYPPEAEAEVIRPPPLAIKYDEPKEGAVASDSGKKAAASTVPESTKSASSVSTTQSAWMFLDAVAAKLDEATTDEAIEGAMTNLTSSLKSLLGNSVPVSDEKHVSDISRKAPPPQPSTSNQSPAPALAPAPKPISLFEAIRRPPRYLLVDCRSPAEREKSGLVLEGALPVAPAHVRDVCRAAIAKKNSNGGEEFKPTKHMKYESSKLLFEFMEFCFEMGGMHFALFDADENEDEKIEKAGGKEEGTHGVAQTAANNNGVIKAGPCSTRPTYQFATALLILGFCRVSIVHGPGTLSVGSEAARQRELSPELQQERTEDEEKALLSLPLALNHFVSRLHSPTDGFHALIISFIGLHGAAVKPFTKSTLFDTRKAVVPGPSSASSAGSLASAYTLASAFVSPASLFSAPQGKKLESELDTATSGYFLATLQPSTIVDKVNKARKLMCDIEEKDAIARIAKQTATHSVSPASTFAPNATLPTPIYIPNTQQPWGDFLGGAVTSSMSMFSFESWPQLPDVGRLLQRDAAESAPAVSVLDSNLGLVPGVSIQSDVGKGYDEGLYSSAALKDAARMQKDKETEKKEKEEIPATAATAVAATAAVQAGKGILGQASQVASHASPPAQDDLKDML